jgi:thiol-disulfide isomerase/thioredoxin
VSENPEAFISLLLVAEIARSTHNYFEADSLLDYLWEGIKKGPTAEKIQHFINSQKKTSIGASAPEFALADTVGKPVALSSTKGNYVLLDFWAAWCKP